MTLSKSQHIAILGSTGSVGQQALEVIGKFNAHYRISLLTAQNNARLLVDQAKRYHPGAVVIGNKEHYIFVKEALHGLPVKVYAGSEAINNIGSLEHSDVVLTAMVGISGLTPTLNAVRQGKKILLANKESLVVAGQIITEMARKHGATILPLDSEHSAITQCLMGEDESHLEKIYLTASGGPFRGMSRHDLDRVTREQALQHPSWNMGDKISIDSATMMNKGLEMIEAKWLFSLGPHQIDVIIHPQSIVHSMVQFRDGSMKAQLGVPDMKHPIAFALSYPERWESDMHRLSPDMMAELTFEPVNRNDFACLDLASDAMHQGGTMPCILNAANEMAVEAFLEERIAFNAIHAVIRQCMDDMTPGNTKDPDELLQIDREVRMKAAAVIKTISAKSR